MGGKAMGQGNEQAVPLPPRRDVPQKHLPPAPALPRPVVLLPGGLQDLKGSRKDAGPGPPGSPDTCQGPAVMRQPFPTPSSRKGVPRFFSF